MALAKILTLSPPPKNMQLALCESTKDEGYSPGLRLIKGSNENQSILLNATYNNYTITNHYRSKDQIENNASLERQLAKLNKKYKGTKQLLRTAAELVNLVPIEELDEEDRDNLCEFKRKWERVTSSKRKVEEVVETKEGAKKAKHQ